MLTLAFRSASDLPLAVAAVRATLAGHGVTALPTETFYGLAVPPGDEEGVACLLALKRRAGEKALPVAVAGVGQLDELAVLEEPWRGRLAGVWPAPLTVVLPSRGVAAAFGGTVAVRVPAHPLLRSLLARVGPLTVTSANPAGEPPATAPGAVARTLGAGLALLLDGGVTPGGWPSTLLDLASSTPSLLRPGAWAVPLEWGVRVP